MGLFGNLFGNDSVKDTSKTNFAWNDLTSLKQLEEIVTASATQPIIVFKHSTRCAISRMALKSFESEYDPGLSTAKLYLLDLLNHRDVSNQIAEKFGVWHESPQLLLIGNGKVVYNASHSDIAAAAVISHLQ